MKKSRTLQKLYPSSWQELANFAITKKAYDLPMGGKCFDDKDDTVLIMMPCAGYFAHPSRK